MGFLQKLKVLWKVRKPAENIVQEAKHMKEGYKTTQFWITILSNLIMIAGALKGVLDPKTAAVILAVLNGLYSTLRNIGAMATTPDSQQVPVTPTTPPVQ